MDIERDALLELLTVFNSQADCCSRVRALVRSCQGADEFVGMLSEQNKHALASILSGDKCECLCLHQSFERAVDELLHSPSRRLASYGSLRPGQCNHGLVSDIPGQWSPGIIRGVVEERHGYPVFTWRQSGQSIPVEVLFSTDLPAHLARLDEFEGREYRRTLVPVEFNDGRFLACSVYSDSRTSQT